jgi:hypothetical protein
MPSPLRLLRPLRAANKSYKGVGDAVMRTLKNEGPLAFWSGFTANFARLVNLRPLVSISSCCFYCFGGRG